MLCEDAGYSPHIVRDHQHRDPQLIQLIQFLETGEPYTLDVHKDLKETEAAKFLLDESSLDHEPVKQYDPDSLLVVPEDLREEIVVNCHDALLAGHFGVAKT